MLCDKCSEIHFRRLRECDIPLDELPEKFRYNSQYQGESVYYFHHKDKFALEASADRGCHFCGMIWGNLFGSFTGHVEYIPESFADKKVFIRRSWRQAWLVKEGADALECTEWLVVCCEGRKTYSSFHLNLQQHIRSFLSALTLCCDPNDPSSFRNSIIPFSSIGGISDSYAANTSEVELMRCFSIYSPWLDARTNSPANLILAKIWLSNCLRDHEECSSILLRSILPRRVIDVSDPEAPFLCIPNGQYERYMTLSYKWGDSAKYMTTTGNENRHYQAISLKLLPWTFREAIYITHWLGIRFLWIDALCIIQDSIEDVQQEIAVMDEIYRNSTLTIFAAGGDNANSGLSVDRNPFWNKPCELFLRTTASGHYTEGHVTVTLDHFQPETLPLSERGWVLQEEILSRRGLIFSNTQLSWRCLCATASERDPQFFSWQQKSQSGNRSIQERYPRGTDDFNRLRFWLLKKNAMPERDGFPGKRTNQFDE
ncbi:heterokaryon incompatibility protein-domain-containing protein [Bisporella sp. PMI_857]|nr:heterokaryon incompatibility protein-domain-containing protein [Bisporella sp. PMI_857]